MNVTELMNQLDRMHKLLESESSALAAFDFESIARLSREKRESVDSLRKLLAANPGLQGISRMVREAIASQLDACQTANRKNGASLNVRIVHAQKALNRHIGPSPAYSRPSRPTVDRGRLIASA